MKELTGYHNARQLYSLHLDINHDFDSSHKNLGNCHDLYILLTHSPITHIFCSGSTPSALSVSFSFSTTCSLLVHGLVELVAGPVQPPQVACWQCCYNRRSWAELAKLVGVIHFWARNFEAIQFIIIFWWLLVVLFLEMVSFHIFKRNRFTATKFFWISWWKFTSIF